MNQNHYINILRIKMDLKTINYIKNNPLIYNYLRVEPKWYKELNRNSINLKELENLAKKHFQLTAEDKLKKLSHNIEIINNLIDVLK